MEESAEVHGGGSPQAAGVDDMTATKLATNGGWCKQLSVNAILASEDGTDCGGCLAHRQNWGRPSLPSRFKPDQVRGGVARFRDALGSGFGSDALCAFALARPSSFRFLRRRRAVRFSEDR